MQIRHNPLSGGYCGEVPPLPIPNREVKLTCADGTAMQCGRVGSRLLSISEASITKVVGAFLFSRGLFFFVTQIWLSLWSPIFNSQMTQIFLWCFFFFPQISQMHTDFRPVRSGISQIFDLLGLGFHRWTLLLLPFYFFTFKSPFTFLPFYPFTFTSSVIKCLITWKCTDNQ